MKNADMPAMPIDLDAMIPPAGGLPLNYPLGLTKREMFAMNAPDIPEWFDIDPDPFVSPLTDEEKKHLKEYSNENYGYEFFELGGDAYLKESKSRRDHSKKNAIELFFRWRLFYADNLLASLEKTK